MVFLQDEKLSSVKPLSFYDLSSEMLRTIFIFHLDDKFDCFHAGLTVLLKFHYRLIYYRRYEQLDRIYAMYVL